MKHLFVPYELALKLKEKGFSEPCFGLWKDQKLISVGGHWGMDIVHSSFGYKDDRISSDEAVAPLYQQVIDWFREKHNLNIIIQLDSNDRYFAKFNKKRSDFYSSPNWAKKDYYEALNQAIEEAIKLLK